MTHSLLACDILKSGGFSETSPNHPVLNHEYWLANNMWKHRNINKLQFNLKMYLKNISVYDYVQILCWVWRSIICCRDKIFYDGFQSEGKWNMDQSGFKSNIISVNSVQNEHSLIWNTHAWAHLLIYKLAIYDICRFFTQSSMKKSKVQTYYGCDLSLSYYTF